ncbi:MAG TPA: helix-turn-helix domain-containing protein [Pyrinomonadaceae bacterium]|nr:helix-turn-helix domain-containing protein [Pyrinomonadaceae bacterium]
MSMSEDEVSRLLSRALRLRKRSPLTDEEVEAFFSAPDSPPEVVERLRAGFVEKAFREKHPEPARFQDRSIPLFGILIAEMRNEARVTLREASAVLSIAPSTFGRLEGGELLPWLVDADEVARLLKLYRLHFDAAESSISRDPESWLPFKPLPRVERRGDLTSAFLDDRHGGNPEPKPEVVKWLADLRKALERLDASDLLN